MRCSCRVCGEYMVHEERGIESRCVCPACFNVCFDCVGTKNGPMSPGELRELFAHDSYAIGSNDEREEDE